MADVDSGDGDSGLRGLATISSCSFIHDAMGQEDNDRNLIEQNVADEEDGGLESEDTERKNKKKRLHESLDGVDKRGVCYLSRVPPQMNPILLRQILSKYGEIQRIYLVPEGPAGQAPRKQAGGFRGKTFSEGWVEFAKKSTAKRVANLLNGEQMGGKKRSPFYYDIWNIKYLSKFKWDDLVSEMTEKTHIREQKLSMEISAAKKQRDHYLSNAEKSRSLKFIQERREKREKTEGAESDGFPETRVIRQIPQKQPVVEAGFQSKSKLSKDILAGVFGGPS